MKLDISNTFMTEVELKIEREWKRDQLSREKNVTFNVKINGTKMILKHTCGYGSFLE